MRGVFLVGSNSYSALSSDWKCSTTKSAYCYLRVRILLTHKVKITVKCTFSLFHYSWLQCCQNQDIVTINYSFISNKFKLRYSRLFEKIKAIDLYKVMIKNLD